MKRSLFAVLLIIAAAIAPRPAAALVNGNTINPATSITIASETVKCSNSSATCFSVGGGTLTVLKGGVVGIGTSAPLTPNSVRLDVKQDVNRHILTDFWIVGNMVQMEAVNDNFSANIPWNIVGNPLILNGAGGNVGVGTPSPATIFDVNGTAQFGSGATKSTFTATGNLDIPYGVNASTYNAAPGTPGGYSIGALNIVNSIGGIGRLCNGFSTCTFDSSTTNFSDIVAAPRGIWSGASPITASTWTATYTGGSAFVCISDAGVMFVSEAACP